jgi:hypothetical protein
MKISLTVVYLLSVYILYEQLQPHVEKIVGNCHHVFQVGKPTIDQIQSISQILEKAVEYRVNTFHFFVDFKAMEGLLKAMKEFKIPVELTELVTVNFETRKL